MFVKFDKTLTVLFPNFLFTLNSFFISIVFYWVGPSKLSLILCLQNIIKFSPWGHSKCTYAPKEEAQDAPKAC